MTDSIDSKPGERNLPDFSKMREIKHSERTEFSDLPVWVRTAISMHDLLGMSWREVCEKVGKSPHTLDNYKKAPAVKQWRAELAEISEDPKAMAEMLMKAHGLSITLEYLSAFEKAISSGDYKETGIMARDLLDRVGIQKKAPKQELPTSIHITYSGRPGHSFEPLAVEAEWETVEEEGEEQKRLADGS